MLNLLPICLQVAAGELELNHECNLMHWSPEDFESKLQVKPYIYIYIYIYICIIFVLIGHELFYCE